VGLLDRRFPRYGREVSLLDDWAICSQYLPHVSALARVYKTFQKAKKPRKPIETSELFAELLKNATWYLQEIGELQECADLLQIACDACEDKNGLVYAYLCNTYVAISVDQNNMARGRFYSQKAIEIREAKLGKGDLDLSISYNNNANVLLNEGRFEEALVMYERSHKIWGDKVGKDETYKALTYLNMGRAYSLKGLKRDYSTAVSYFEKAEVIFSFISNKMFLIG